MIIINYRKARLFILPTGKCLLTTRTLKKQVKIMLCPAGHWANSAKHYWVNKITKQHCDEDEKNIPAGNFIYCPFPCIKHQLLCCTNSGSGDSRATCCY